MQTVETDQMASSIIRVGALPTTLAKAEEGRLIKKRTAVQKCVLSLTFLHKSVTKGLKMELIELKKLLESTTGRYVE